MSLLTSAATGFGIWGFGELSKTQKKGVADEVTRLTSQSGGYRMSLLTSAATEFWLLENAGPLPTKLLCLLVWWRGLIAV
jgi:hypothetical protein